MGPGRVGVTRSFDERTRVSSRQEDHSDSWINDTETALGGPLL